MITRRDDKVIAFLDEFKAAHTQTIHELFYPSYSVAARRLRVLLEAGEVSRVRDGWNSEFIYYRRKPKQIRHAVLLTDFLREFRKVANVVKFKPEPVYDKIRPDAVAGFELRGKKRVALIEVKISNNDDLQKYQSFDCREHFPVQPYIFLISDLPSNFSGYKVISIKSNLEGLRCSLQSR